MERIRILLVDDDRQNSELLRKFLEVEDYEVDYAENGRAGWEMYAANRPDLVLLDINMPEMNGFELARKIREQDRDVLIFFLTDRTEKADQRYVFDKFYRSESAKDKAIPGIGLGLSYVKLLVEAHGGNISFDSTEGEGTTFTIVIPQRDGED